MEINLDEKKSILHIKLSPPLKATDFIQLSSVADSYLKDHDMLNVIIETEKFPGWENIHALIAHVKFVKKHISKVKKIALVTNSKFAMMGEKFIGPLIKHKVRRFPYDQVELAQQWIEEPAQ